MAKITAEQLKQAQRWESFAQKLGWSLVSCDHDWAKFNVKGDNGLLLSVTLQIEMRRDIEATWRDQDKPKLESVSNG